jgi:hypothetical protein
MHRHYCLCCSWLILAVMAVPARGQVKLEWKLKEGDKFYLEEITALKQNTKFMGMDIRHELNQTRITRFTVLKKNNDNSYLLEQKIETVRAKRGSTSGKADVRMVQQLQGATFKVTLNPKMHVTKFEGYEAQVKKMSNKEDVQKMVRILMPEESFLRATEALFGFLSEKPVAKGQSWTYDLVRPLGPLGVLKIENTYTSRGEEKVDNQQAVKLEVAAVKSSYTPPKANGGAGFQVTKGDIKVDPKRSSGTLYFNAATGRLIKSSSRLQLTGSLSVTFMGTTLNMDVEHEETITARILDKNPLQ